MQIVEKKIGELKPYENNPRKNKDAVEYVANSIREFGWQVPIVIDKNNTIVAGHTRYLAAIELGIDKIPCVVAENLSEEQIKAFRIADNKVSEQSGWDFDLLNAELNDVFDIDMEQFGFVETCIEEINFDEFDKQLSNLEGEELVSLSVSVPASKKSFVNDYLRNGEADTAIGRGKGVLKRCELH